MTKAKQLYPIVMRPGIKRDGTPFQSEYCSDGDWVRWQKGMPRSMKGMVTPLGVDNRLDHLPIEQSASDIFIGPYNAASQNMVIISGRFFYVAVMPNIKRYGENVTNLKWISTTQIQNLGRGDDFGDANVTLWQTAQIKTNGESYFFWYGTPNKAGFDVTNGASVNFAVKQSALDRDYGRSIQPEPILRFNDADVPRDIDGGMCYSAPYLFLFGTGGTVRVSRGINCFDFRTVLPADEQANGFAAQNIPLPVSDKVVCGYPIRAGANAPTLLFWTLSSLVRMSNVATTNDVQPVFKSDVISQSISILSNKCLVEYDGLFFWIGDRFFVYNGNTNALPNTISNDFFFNNLDTNRAALVHGVKMPRYGEIWWFYPEKATANDPLRQGCTRAIIYNKAENSWYDTAIPTLAATYPSFLGKVITYGKPKIPDPTTVVDFPQVWAQDLGRSQISLNKDDVSTRPDIGPIAIPKFFTTPYFSFTAFNPLKQQVGADNQTLINRLEPDFISSDGQNTNIDVYVNTIAYGNSQVVTTQVGTIVIDYDEIKGNASPMPLRTEKIDMAIQGGAISLTFVSNGAFEMGHNLVLLSVGDGNR